MYIAITIGHSMLKNGSITSADGTHLGGGNEYKFNKTFAPYIAKELRANGHKVEIIQCPEKVFTSDKQEKTYKLNLVNKMGYDLVIELHCNASNNPVAEGCEVLYKSENGKKYAERVQKQLAKVFLDRGVKKRDDLYILNSTKPVAILLETFFCTNKKEYKYAVLHKGKLAKLIAEDIGK